MEDDREKSLLTHAVEVGVENFEVDHEKISLILEVIAKQYKVESYQITLSFITQEEMQELNLEHRDKPSSTDVLSFPQLEWREPLTIEKIADHKVQNFREMDDGFRSPVEMLGDLVISLEDAERNAESIG